MAKVSKKKPIKRGRPDEGRHPFLVHILPDIASKIDGMVDKDDPLKSSRGRIVESRFTDSVN